MFTDVGLGTPFINVSFTGLLWGYEDELYCLKLPVPRGCNKGDSPFGEDYEEEADEDWDFRRKKRSVLNDREIVEKLGEVVSLPTCFVSFTLFSSCFSSRFSLARHE